MLKKKLLTLACAVGILACGACFAPDLIDKAHRPPPPPPAVIDLRGIHSIGVVVTNDSGLPALDGAMFAEQVRDSINFRTPGIHVKAQLKTDPDRADALLTISVLNERVVSAPAANGTGYGSWTVHFDLSAKLVTRDGRVIWSEANSGYEFPVNAPATDASTILQASQRRAAYQLGTRIVHRMFYGN